MTNKAHKEPVVCPECGELIIVTTAGSAVFIPAHPDAAWPGVECTVSAAAVVARFILH